MGTQNSDFTQTVEMLNYFQDEWKYRHHLVLTLFFKLFTFNIVIDILPFITSAFGMEFSFNNETLLIIFPILGLVISLFGYHLLNSECVRLSAVGKAKYRIIRLLSEQFQYEKLENAPLIALSIPKIYLISQITIVIISLVFFYFK